MRGGVRVVTVGVRPQEVTALPEITALGHMSTTACRPPEICSVVQARLHFGEVVVKPLELISVRTL